MRGAHVRGFALKDVGFKDSAIDEFPYCGICVTRTIEDVRDGERGYRDIQEGGTTDLATV